MKYLLLLLAFTACSESRKAVLYHPTHVNVLDSCKRAIFGNCGLYLSDCSSGKEYQCVVDVVSEEVK